jgi:hypothetical protein
MILISHRGNLSGPGTAGYGENHPASIAQVLGDGYACEVDVRYLDGQFWLGHDSPEYRVGAAWLDSNQLYVHCKNIEALLFLKDMKWMHAFYHTDEDVVLLTNSNLLWTYPKQENILTKHSIAVLPEVVGAWMGVDVCAGVCSDFICKYTAEV